MNKLYALIFVAIYFLCRFSFAKEDEKDGETPEEEMYGVKYAQDCEGN